MFCEICGTEGTGLCDNCAAQVEAIDEGLVQSTPPSGMTVSGPEHIECVSGPGALYNGLQYTELEGNLGSRGKGNGNYQGS